MITGHYSIIMMQDFRDRSSKIFKNKHRKQSIRKQNDLERWENSLTRLFLKKDNKT